MKKILEGNSDRDMLLIGRRQEQNI